MSGKNPLKLFVMLVLMLLLVAVGFAGGVPLRTVQADDPKVVDLIVEVDGREVLVRRVSFTEDSLSGLDVLQQSGLDVETLNAGFGTAVCSIEGYGCPASDCFCADNTWTYSFWNDSTGTWENHPTGADSTTITDGSFEGWRLAAEFGALPRVGPEALAGQAGMGFLRELPQEADGSIGSAGINIEVILSGLTNRVNVATFQNGQGNSPLNGLRNAAVPSDPATKPYQDVDAASAGKLAKGIAAADLDPRTFADIDLVDVLEGYYNSSSNTFGSSTWDQAFGMLGWSAAGEEIPPDATLALLGYAYPDGKWGFLPSSTPEADNLSFTDSTALAIQALQAGLESDDLTGPQRDQINQAISDGLAYLQTQQQPDGGFSDDDTANANTTAYTVQGILAGSQNPLAAPWTQGDNTPLSFLLQSQRADGSFTGEQSALLATTQTLPAVTGQTFPYRSKSVALRTALAWITDQQQPNGSFDDSPGSTADAVLAIYAAGGTPPASALTYLEEQAASYTATGPGATGKLMMAVVAAGGDVRDTDGINLIDTLQTFYADASPEGAYADSIGPLNQAYAILGSIAAGHTPPSEAVDYLKGLAEEGGGWAFTPGNPPDTNTTSLAMQALIAAGVAPDDEAIVDALIYLRGTQNDDGGFGYQSGDATAINSTGLVLQALAAVGQNPRYGLTWTTTQAESTGGLSRIVLNGPVQSVLNAQTLAGGFRDFGADNNAFTTYQIVPALADQPLPLKRATVLYLPVVQQSTGS